MGDSRIEIPALVVPVSGSWYGNDGSWSTFTISVGTPPQNFSVLPATNLQNTWVPIADDCKLLNVTNCGSKRGVWTFDNSPSPGFQRNFSTTWEPIGLYELAQNTYLGYSGNGISGYDTVGLVSNNVSWTLQIKHQAVTAYATPSFWLGQIGLAKKGMNFGLEKRPESFLTNLKAEKMIPSLSYGFTAGASYRLTKVPASLTLGGYDQSRVDKVLQMPISEDEDRPLSIALQNMSATNTLNGTVKLSDGEDSIVIPIDSSIPDLWLPQRWCDQIASAFGLRYNSETNRYILSAETRSRLRQLSPVLTFTLGTRGTKGKTIDIQVPYAAMDLQASAPVFANTVDYFPIRRAANETQYMLGRAFLQEVYIGVDYERNYFNVSQAIFTDPMPTANIVTIAAVNGPTNTTHGRPPRPPVSTHKLSAGQIVGIVLGALAALALLVSTLWWRLRRNRKQKERNIRDKNEGDISQEDRIPQGLEMSSNQINEMHENQSHVELQVPATVVHEVAGSTPRIHEMD